MASVFPGDIWPRFKAAEAELSPGERAEFETLRVLQEKLPEDYSLFFNLEWAFLDGRRMHSRELDFVVCNRRGQCVIVEQKMGRLEETPHGLVKAYGENRKSVVEQVLDSLNGLKANFRRANPKARPLDVSYLLFCPNHRVVDRNAAGLDPDCIVDSSKAGRLIPILRHRLGGKKEWTDSGKHLNAFLKRQFRIVPDVGSVVSVQGERFTQLAQGTIDFLSNLEMDPLQLFISGVAGCGKTILAHHYYEESLERGGSPLLVCFNAPLAQKFRDVLPDGGEVDTFFGVFRSIADRPDSGIEFDVTAPGGPDWGQMLEQVAEVLGPEDARFDRLIVDEGQDLTQEAYEFLRLLLKDNADVVWMEDRDQNLGQRATAGGPFDASSFVRLKLQNNYRTPLKIAQFMRDKLPFDFEPANALSGYPVNVSLYRNDDEQLELLEDAVSRLTGKGFNPGDIAIITCRGMGGSTVGDLETIGGLPIRKFTGDYDDNDRQVYTEGELTFETVRRFKGQQSPVVLLVDVDPQENREIDLRVLYCGMTRATVCLEVFGKKENIFNQNLMK